MSPSEQMRSIGIGLLLNRRSPPDQFRALITDLDGTLLRTDGSASAETLAALTSLRAQGIRVIVASARTPYGFKAVDGLSRCVDAAAWCNGALVFDPASGERIAATTIPAHLISELLTRLNGSLPELGVAVFDGVCWRISATYDRLRPGDHPRGPVEVLPDHSSELAVACHTLSIRHPKLKSARVAALVEDHIGGSAAISYSNPDVVDVAPASITKATGITSALCYLNLDSRLTIAFGDMPNDREMFDLAGYAVAMGGAHPELIAVADAVTRSADEDGVAAALAGLGVLTSRGG